MILLEGDIWEKYKEKRLKRKMDFKYLVLWFLRCFLVGMELATNNFFCLVMQSWEGGCCLLHLMSFNYCDHGRR
jgi:hypothetical protein